MSPFKRSKRLRAEARDAATWRGHDLAPFKRNAWRPNTVWSAECRRCECLVSVFVEPAPNETDIMGDAVAIGCAGAKK